MSRLLRYLNKKRKTKYVPRHYANPYRPRALTADEQLVMSTGHARDPYELKLLMEAYNVQSVEELILLLPSLRPRPSWRRRLHHLVQKIEGHYRGRWAFTRPRQVDEVIPIRYTFRRKK